jgi:hypothetical protein
MSFVMPRKDNDNDNDNNASIMCSVVLKKIHVGNFPSPKFENVPGQ